MLVQDMARRVASVEKARREKDYALMNSEAVALSNLMKGDHSAEAYKVRAKLSYELHMADFQIYQDAPDHPPGLLVSSMELAEVSSAEAKFAGDLAGELFPQMNIGGYLLPALGRWGEGAIHLKLTLDKAVVGMTAASAEDAYRLSRVVMNCYLHLIDIAITHNGKPADVERWQKAAEATAVFAKEYKDSDWGRERAHRAQAFVQAKR